MSDKTEDIYDEMTVAGLSFAFAIPANKYVLNTN